MRRAKFVLTGSLADYFVKALLLSFLTVISFGLLLPFWIWWNVKHFTEILEVEFPDS